MKTSLRNFWASRTPRERVFVIVMTMVVGCALYIWLWQSSNQARRQAAAAVRSLSSQTLRFEQDAAEYERLRSLPAVTASNTPLREVVQAQTDAAGLSKAQIRIDAPEPNRVQVVFGAVAFTDWLAWLASLQAQQIRLDSCRIEALSSAGMVGVTATLVRAKQP
jgi:general secretion pathway protein M